MIDPVSALGIASSAVGGIAKDVTNSVNQKENQKTIRVQSQMDAVVHSSQCLSQVVDAYHNYQNLALEEARKRDEISAWEKTSIEEIKTKKEILLVFLEKSFVERAQNFRNLFDLADKAIEERNSQNLGLVLDKISELVKTNPFQDLADVTVVQKALDDPQHEWKF